MSEPLQSFLDLLTTEQRRVMAAMLLRIAADERVPQADRASAARRAAELDPQFALPESQAAPLDANDTASQIPPSSLFGPRKRQG